MAQTTTAAEPAGAPAPASASSNTAASVADRSTEFVAVSGNEETTSATTLLVAAYAAMWLLILLFVWQSWRRQARLDKRLDELARALERRGDPGEA